MKVRHNVVLVAFVLSPSCAFAYVDPGSGMLVWQGLLAAIGAVIVFVRNPKDVLKQWIARFRKKR